MSNNFAVRFAAGPSGWRAALVGSGLDIWEVISAVRDSDNDPAHTAAFLEIPLGLVKAAIAYYGEHRDEIDAEIALNQAEWERGYPGLTTASAAPAAS